MNQIILEVKLFAENTDDDILAFAFEDEECRVNLNSDSCQGELKEVFSKLVKLCLQNEVTLKRRIEDGYSRGLYKDVCSEYVTELQRELDRIKDRIRREVSAE